MEGVAVQLASPVSVDLDQLTNLTLLNLSRNKGMCKNLASFHCNTTCYSTQQDMNGGRETGTHCEK